MLVILLSKNWGKTLWCIYFNKWRSTFWQAWHLKWLIMHVFFFLEILQHCQTFGRLWIYITLFCKLSETLYIKKSHFGPNIFQLRVLSPSLSQTELNSTHFQTRDHNTKCAQPNRWENHYQLEQRELSLTEQFSYWTLY